MDGAGRNAAVCRTNDQGGKSRGISGSTIKIIAVAAMLTDHVAAALLTRMILARGYRYAAGNTQTLMAWMRENSLLFFSTEIMRLIGRLGFPIFCFLLVEGFQKTRSVGKYAFRLGIFALASEIPFDLAFAGKVASFGYQNVYFTLLIGLLLLWAFQFIADWDPAGGLRMLLTAGGILIPPLYASKGVYDFAGSFLEGFRSVGVDLGDIGRPVFVVIYFLLVCVMLAAWGIYRHVKGSGPAWRMCGDMAALGIAMYAADLLRTDYAGMGVLTIAVMYALRKNKVLSAAGGCGVLTFMSLNEVTSFFILIPIALYNGKRGLRMKYFFYAFYPVHLFLIWLICLAMGMGWMSAL